MILVVSPASCDTRQVEQALEGGDIASVILHSHEKDNSGFEPFCRDVIPIIQARDIAAIVANDSQIMGRCGADGLYADQDLESGKDLIARFSPQKIVGFGNIMNRHDALSFGELGPDFLFFGKLGGDKRAKPHPKNLELANWWSELVEIPCIVMGVSCVESVRECAASGAEFVALERAVFDGKNVPNSRVEEANRLLELNSKNHG